MNNYQINSQNNSNSSHSTNQNNKDNQSKCNTEQSQSENQKQPKFIQTPSVMHVPLMQPEWFLNELQLKRVPSTLQCNQLTYLMFQLLHYPSLKQAQTHTFANRLGMMDINKQGHANKHKQYCKCCGYAKQQEAISLCTPFNNFPSVGISTYLFFQTIKNLIWLLILTTMVHSIYSLTTNLYIMNNINNDKENVQINIDNIISWISLNSKVAASTNSTDKNFSMLYLIEMWIGVGLVTLWSLLLYLIRYFQRKYQAMVNKQTISAADFSIIIENYPRHLSKQSLQKQLDQYAIALQCDDSNFFKIQTINMNVVSNLNKVDQEQLQQINEKYNQMMEMFADWVSSFDQNNGLPFTSSSRKKMYEKFTKIRNLRFQKSKNLMHTIYEPKHTIKNNNINQDIVESQQDTTSQIQKGKTIAVVTFKYSNSKDLISKFNSMDVAKTIRHLIRCCPEKNKLILKDETNNQNKPFENLKISKAPQPQDIKWQNLQVPYFQKILRKAGTYLVTFILLAISFVLVYLLSVYQMNNSSNFYLNFIVSFTISIVNFIIGFLIRFLTVFEKDYTQTGYQTSLAIKSIGAQLLNSIVVPIIVNYIIEKKNIFGVNGLSSDIIFLSITNSFLPPLSKLIDPYHKYIILRGYYFRNSLRERLLLKQSQLNESQELMQFQTGYQYIYFVNLYLFTSYFVSLQPCICIFAIVGMGFMYWVQKYSLLNRIKRPIPGTDLVNTAISQLVNLGPLFYAIGALSWSHFLDGYKVQQGVISYYVPNILAGGLAAIFFIFPFNIVFDKYLPKVELQNLDYKQCRILLNSQYDRCNPATMEAAIKQYQNFLENYIEEQQKEIKSTTKQEKSKNKKKIAFQIAQTNKIDDQSSHDFNKEENSQINSKLRSEKGPKIDRKFINRKRQIIRTKTYLKNIGGVGIGQNMASLLSSPEPNHINMQQQIIGKQISKNDFPESTIWNSNNKNQFKEFNKTIKFSENIGQKNEQVKTKIKWKDKQNINNQINTQLINIEKQKQAKPKKINIDFKSFLPLENQNYMFQGSNLSSRDDSYTKYFSKNLNMDKNPSSIKQNRSIQKQKHNPYQKAFN